MTQLLRYYICNGHIRKSNCGLTPRGWPLQWYQSGSHMWDIEQSGYQKVDQ